MRKSYDVNNDVAEGGFDCLDGAEGGQWQPFVLDFAPQNFDAVQLG